MLNESPLLFLVQLFLGYVFVVSGLIVNILQLFSCILWPINKKLYRKVNCHLAISLWSQMCCMYNWWSASDVDIYIDKKDLEFLKHEHSICLVNHKFEIDWLVGWVICQRCGILGGSKIVGKQELQYIPIVGTSWFFTESIFLRRVWETDKAILVNDIQRLLGDYPKNYYFSFLMACEGTRFTELKRLASMQVAHEKGLPELKHHILPRTRGFTMIMQGAKGKIAGVYNFQLGFTKESAKPTLRTLIRGQSCKAELYVKRTPIDNIPYDDDEKCGAWLHKKFQEKDEIYDYFIKNGTFAGLGLQKISVPRNFEDLFWELFWIGIIGLPSIVLLANFFIFYSFQAKLIFIFILVAAILCVQRMIKTSEIKTEVTQPMTMAKSK